MIEALYEFGKTFLKDNNITGEVSPEKVSADLLLILNFDRSGNLLNISSTRNIGEITNKLLYKKVRASRRCNACTPTFFLNVNEPSKSVKCLKAIFNWLKRYNSEVPEIKDFQKVTLSLKEYIHNFPPKGEKVLLTVRIDGKFPAEIPEIVEAFRKGYLEELGFVSGICSLCGKKTKVSGEKSPLAFYTLDKIGYLSGFSIKHHYRGFPLCFKCFQILERAKGEVDKHKFSLTKFAPKYWLIPELILSKTAEEGGIEEIYENIYDLEYLKHHLNLTERELQRLSDTDEDILDLLKELKDVLTFHFVFIEKRNSQELIKLHIQDVYPSRIKELFEAKSYVEKSLEFEEFTFKTLGQFFWKWDKNSKNRDLEKHFLELLDRTFRKVPYSETLLIRFLLNGIRQAYREEIEEGKNRLSYKSLDALASYLFVKATTEGKMSEIGIDDVKSLTETLPLLKLPEAKGLFLLGVLTQKLLDKQAKSRNGNKPFLKKLSDFKLNERGFKKLMTELRSKMEAYKIFGKFERELFDLASEYFVQSNNPWKLSLEEMNFIFAVGMGMKGKIYEKRFHNKED